MLSKNILFKQKRQNYEINSILWKINRDYAKHFKNALNFLVA
jgi:hypothetical protein